MGDKYALREISGDADEVLCIRAPKKFSGVSAYYGKFPQVADSEAADILREYCKEYCPQ